MLRKMEIFVLVLILSALLVSCSNSTPFWSIASNGDSCTQATVIDKSWTPATKDTFYLLLKKDNGEIGQSMVSPYSYDSLQVGDVTCVK